MIDNAIYVAIEQAICWRARSNWDGNQQPRLLVPQKHELTTQEAASFLNVSRPFVIKEIEANRLKCRKVNRHRRIEFEELRRYQTAQQQQSAQALQDLTQLSEELRLEF